MAFNVFVKMPNAQMLEFSICPSDTVEKLKEKIQDVTGRHPDQLRLRFADRRLEDGHILSERGIRHQSIIHADERIRGGGGGPYEQHGLGDRTGRNMSKEHLDDFNEPGPGPPH